MGVIARQSMKHSIVTFVAIALGAVNILLIYPYCLTAEEYGILQWILNACMLLVPFLAFGSNSLSVRFFPNFQSTDHQHHGFLSLLLLIPFIGFSLSLVVSLVFSSHTLAFIEQQSRYTLLIIPISIALVYTNLLSAYCINFRRIVIPNMLSNLFPKTAIPILAIAYFFWHQDLSIFLFSVTIVYWLIMVGVVMYVKILGELNLRKIDLKFISKDLQQQMKTYAFYGIAGRMSSRIAFSLDIFMLGTMLEYKAAGIYSIAAFIGNTIDAPKQSMNKISSGILAKAYSDNDQEEIKTVYYKSCINQFIVALFLFIGIWVSIDFLFDIMPNSEEFRTGKYVVCLLGVARLIDAITGVNNEVIGQSQYFRFNFHTILFLSILNIILNLIFISFFGILGVAFATLISVSLYNIAKTIFIFIKMKLQPFDFKIVTVMLIGLVTYGLSLTLPITAYPLVNIVIHSVFIGTVYPLAIYFLKVSPDLNSYIDFGLQKIGFK